MNYRVLTRLCPPDPIAAPAEARIALYVDVETTGLDPRRDEIIELAMAPFYYMPSGEIVGAGEPYSALRQPSSPIPPAITELTGITDEMVAGRSIDVDEVASYAAGASLVIAHNATFDRRFLERFSDIFSAKPWACSMTEVPWIEEGYESLKLSHLANRMANHIVKRGDLKNWTSDACVVDTIAALEPLQGVKSRHFRSFASKYAHIFIDPARYHILDDAAVRVLARHAGVTTAVAKGWNYREFNKLAEELRSVSGLGSNRSLDRYLWIAGMLLRDRKTRKSKLTNQELQGVFLGAESQSDIEIIREKLPPNGRQARLGST